MRLPSRLTGRVLVTLLVMSALPGGAVVAQAPAVVVGPACGAAFAAAESVVEARGTLPSATPSVPSATPSLTADPSVPPGPSLLEGTPVSTAPLVPTVATLDPALVDPTIAACASAEEWTAVAAAHPSVLGKADLRAVLAARCADAASGLAGSPACAPVSEPELVDRPSVKPRVKGVRSTRYYPIVGLSPDELFTQMQVNGSAGCPTHALACVNVQPIIRPLVSAGSGACRVLGVRASLAMQAVLPRWAGPDEVYRELVAWWRTVAARIGRHETEHVRIANRHLYRLRREIVGKPCSSLNAYVARWSKGLTAAQDAFDRKDAKRPWPEYDGPVP